VESFSFRQSVQHVFTLCSFSAPRYHVEADTLLDQYLTPASQGNEPVPVSAIINNMGQGDCRGSNCSYAVVPAVNGTCEEQRTVLRIINTAGFGVFVFSIDDHDLLPIAVDALPIKATRKVQALRINAGQRYDVSVCPRTPTAGTPSVWARAHMQQSVFASEARDPQALAVLQYGASSAKPRMLPTSTPSPDQLVSHASGLSLSTTPGSTGYGSLCMDSVYLICRPRVLCVKPLTR